MGLHVAHSRGTVICIPCVTLTYGLMLNKTAKIMIRDS